MKTSRTGNQFHKLLKLTIGKQLQKGLEWDVWKATAAYNFFPTESSRVAPFFLMFGHEATVKHMLLESESSKYVGTDKGCLNVKLMKKLYHVVAYNLVKSRATSDGNQKDCKPPYIKVGMNILKRDHTSGTFKANYKDWCIVKLEGKID